MKRVILWTSLLLCAAPSMAEPQPDVQQAAKSVYRIWLGVPLPSSFLKQIDGSHIQAMQTQNFTEQVPLKGMSLRDKKSGKLKALTGKGILFQYAGRNYLLVATASAFAVSNKGDLVTNARFADNTSAVDAVFVDGDGLRDIGENGGHAEVFVLTNKANNVNAIELLAAKQVVRDVESDVAVIQADNLPTTALPLADTQFAKPADLLFALGVEGESNQLSGKVGAIDRVDYLSATASEGKLEKRVKHKNIGMWLHSAPFSGSVSGGALVNQCGQVLGINQVLDKKPLGDVQVAVDVGKLLSMLRKHSIGFRQYQGRCGGVIAKVENIADGAERVVIAAKHNPRGWLSVLGLAIVTLLSSVVAFRLLRWVWTKRRKHQQQHRVVAPPSHTAHQATVTRTVVPHTQLDSPNDIVLNAISGSLNHITVPSYQPIVIGRNDDCDVIIPDTRISRHHAKLWQDNGVLYVQDLNSTNGTFVNGNPTHGLTRLQTGDVVQLTADDQLARFRVAPANRGTIKIKPITQLHQLKTPHLAAVLQPLNAHLPRIEVPISGSLNIGRATDNHIVIAQPQISSKHCCIQADAYGNLTLIDLGSSNGTFVDHFNQRISQTLVQTGQTIYLADQSIAYRIQAA